MKKGNNPNNALELIVNIKMISFIEFAYSFTLSIEDFEKKSTHWKVLNIILRYH